MTPMNLQVIFGPPGTGKTTLLAELIRQYAGSEGSDRLMVMAFTRAATEALNSHQLPLVDGQCGTVHSISFHALGRPTIAETKVKEWNTIYSSYRMSLEKSTYSDEMWGMDETMLVGDRCLNDYNLLRHLQIAESQWPDSLKGFIERWTAWKYDEGLVDFTDLLVKTLALYPVAPGNPSTIILDEAQDFSPLQWALIRQWGQHATRVIAAGDDDQALYRWAGADFRPLLAATDRHVLPHSYRVPRRLYTWAQQFTAHIQRRQPKHWEARAEAGHLAQEDGDWREVDSVVRRLRRWLQERTGSFACIAPCAYMLRPLIRALTEAGMPFGNRWRRTRTDWNPLVRHKYRVTPTQQVLDFCRTPDRLWSWPELTTWITLLRSDGILRPAAQQLVSQHVEDTHLCTMAELEALFLPEALQGALHGGLKWLTWATMESQRQRLTYPMAVYRTYGRTGLQDPPRITVGTAHSLKGAEADTVFFWPELSRAQELARCEGGDASDDIYRMLYVASTRARESLYVMGGAT